MQLFSNSSGKQFPLHSSSQQSKISWLFSQKKQLSINSIFISSVLLLTISSSLYAEPLTQPPAQNSTSQLEKNNHVEREDNELIGDNKEQIQQISLQTTEIQNNQKQPNNQDNDWLFLHNYEAKYAVQSDGDTLGHATRKLTLKDGSWTLATYAKLKKYFLSVKNTETTTFHLSDSHLVTDRFYSKTKITFKKARVMEQNFDWVNKLETGKRKDKTWKIPLEKQVFDRVSHIIQIRSDLLTGKTSLNYDVSYKGKFQVFSYSKEGKETLQTQMGALTGVKLVRQKTNGDIFALWLCPELNYLPIKIAQYEQDKADVTLVLESLKYQSDDAS